MVSDTDFTGFLYFTKLQDIGLECFMDNFCDKNPEGNTLLLKSSFLLPIVHAEANYKLPVTFGDTLHCYLKVMTMGTTSFSYRVKSYLSDNKLVGDSSVVHVCVDRQTGHKIPIPVDIRKVLLKL